jgi:hypothetical protein
MGKFSLLFSTEIEHLFFPDSCCRHLDLALSAASQKLIADIGLVIRKSANGIFFFYDQNRKDALFLAAGDQREPLHFFIKAYSRDSNFMNYTGCPILNETTILYFDNHGVKAKASKDIVLNKARWVSDKDQKSITAASITPNLSKQDRFITPMFVFDIFVEQGPGGLIGKPFNVRPKRYVIRFKNRETYWKYFLLNDLAKDNFYIEDINNRVKFEKPIVTKLVGRKTAFTIRSSVPLPLVEAPKEHFQLKVKNGGNDKIIVRRLPVPSADRLSREVIDGYDAAVSEIFINC